MRAVEIAQLLGLPEPTPEQVDVIEAGLEPVLVVAGAGSGKTETMAGRVVYLVANGLVEADRILGLTFTRRAAGELGLRIRRRLAALTEKAGGVVPAVGAPPTVSTYNSYAAGLVAEHGLRIGVEPDARLLGEAALWQLVSEVVESSDVGLETVGTSAGYLTQQTVSLLGQCLEHLVEPAAVQRFSEGFQARVASLPGSVTQDLGRVLQASRTRGMLAELVAEVVARKRERNVLDFADQVGHAARLAQLPDVAALERDRFEVVLLDEYQDTSVAQLQLLSGLFASHSVTAVGDPHQSIYGWRGASAGNLEGFPAMFPRSDGAPAQVLSLATSWRNDSLVLDVANVIAAPLISASRVDLPTLRARPDTGAGTVRIRWHETAEDEVDCLASDFAARWHAEEAAVLAGQLDPALRTSHAVLSRRRKDFSLIETALRAQGLPVRVFGLGGLLDRPEVGDVVATLRVLADPTRGDSLMRLLTGPRWRIGARDLRALNSWANETSGESTALESGVAELSGDRLTAGPEDLWSAGIVEALDALPDRDWLASNGSGFSAAGYERLTQFSRELARLRRRIAMPLVELIGEVERVLRLDVELAARPGINPTSARSQLDEFIDVAADFANSAGGGAVLPAFLSWLEAAAARERGLDLGEGDPDESDDEQRIGAEYAERREVHLLTVHAAKGLEWDVVAVPALIEGGFPHINPRADNRIRDSGWSTDAGMLPYPLRGDRANLPEWNHQVAQDTKALATSWDGFKIDCGTAKVAEERRLAYVAFTRARHELVLSGTWWRDGKRRRVPSRFLLEVLNATDLNAEDLVPAGDEAASAPRVMCDPSSLSLLSEGSSHDANPSTQTPDAASWPVDPLGEARPATEEAAERVRVALGELAVLRGSTVGGSAAQQPEPGAERRVTRWSAEIDALLAERALQASSTVEIELPQHLSASQAVMLARDPEAVALNLRRPVPTEPGAGARRGSAFHAWLEKRFGMQALVDLEDIPGAGDEAAGPVADLAALQRGFERSQWADRQVIAVESDIETPVAGTILRGRVDAVFSRDDGGVDIVDWKTGRPPSGAAAEAARIQLAVYRVAWARLHAMPIDRVHASFCYVATGETVSPTAGLDENQLIELIQSVPLVDASPSGSLGPATAVEPSDSVAQPVPRAAEPVRRAVRNRRHEPPEDQLSLFDD